MLGHCVIETVPSEVRVRDAPTIHFSTWMSKKSGAVLPFDQRPWM
jgi:hypothetical protein